MTTLLPLNKLPTIKNQEPFLLIRSCSKETEAAAIQRRKTTLKRVDNELSKHNFKAAVSLVKQLHSMPSCLRGFGVFGPQKVSRNGLNFDEVELNMDKDSTLFRSIVDSVLDSVNSSIEFQLMENEMEEVLVQNLGEIEDSGISNSNLGEIEDCGSSESVFDGHLACAQHEAGHFLVGYMLGVLPRRYKVPSMEELSQDEFAGGYVDFVGFESLINVNVPTMSTKRFSRGSLGNKTLKKYIRVLLGGMVAEYLSLGYSELLHSDVQKLDSVLKRFRFNENEIDFEVRHAAEDTVSILCSQKEARCRLAKAMAMGKSVGFCIDTIEETLVFKVT